MIESRLFLICSGISSASKARSTNISADSLPRLVRVVPDLVARFGLFNNFR